MCTLLLLLKAAYLNELSTHKMLIQREMCLFGIWIHFGGWFPGNFGLELRSLRAKAFQCLPGCSGEQLPTQTVWSPPDKAGPAEQGGGEPQRAGVNGMISTPGNNLKGCSVTTPHHPTHTFLSLPPSPTYGYSYRTVIYLWLACARRLRLMGLRGSDYGVDIWACVGAQALGPC